MPQCSGKIHDIGDVKGFGDRGFCVLILVLIKVDGDFTQYIPFEFKMDDTELVSGFAVGDEVSIDYELGGRMWQKDTAAEVRYFLSAGASAITLLTSSGRQQGSFVPDGAAEEDIPF